MTTTTGRASPPTDRVVAVLDFLAAHPADRFGLSDLARRVGLSKPTCLGIVTSLAEAGYLVRDPADKSYRLAFTGVGDRLTLKLFDLEDLSLPSAEVTVTTNSLSQGVPALWIKASTGTYDVTADNYFVSGTKPSP